MENLEQENCELHEEVTALRDGMTNLKYLVESFVDAQNQPPPPSPLSPHATQPQQLIVILEVMSVPISVTPVTSTQYRMPHGPWGMPENFMSEGYNPDAQVAPFTQTVVVSAPLVVHTTLVSNNEIHHVAPPIVNSMLVINDKVYHHAPPPSESLGFYGRERND